MKKARFFDEKEKEIKGEVQTIMFWWKVTKNMRINGSCPVYVHLHQTDDVYMENLIVVKHVCKC